MAKYPPHPKNKKSSLAVILGCSYTTDDWWTTEKVHLANAAPQGPWPMWGELFFQQLNKNTTDNLEVINLATNGAGIDQMLKRFYKFCSMYQDRIKFVVIGGSGLERWDWPLSFMDLEWQEVAPQALNDTNDRYVGKYSRSNFRAIPSNKSNWKRVIKDNETNIQKNLIAAHETVQTLEARDRFLSEKNIIWEHFNSKDPALWNDPVIIDVILKNKLSWQEWIGRGEFNWFEKEYYRGALHQHHSYLRARQHFDVKHRYVIEYCQKILMLMNFCKAADIKFLYYQLLPLFEVFEDSDKHTQPHLPFCINQDATSDEIFLQSDMYDIYKKNKKHIVNFDPYCYHNYDRMVYEALDIPSEKTKVTNKDGKVLDGHPGKYGQELIAANAWDWYAKHW